MGIGIGVLSMLGLGVSGAAASGPAFTGFTATSGLGLATRLRSAGSLAVAEAGLLRTAALGYTIGGDVIGVGQSSQSLYASAVHGEAFNPLSLLGFLPTIGWAGSLYRGAKGFSRRMAGIGVSGNATRQGHKPLPWQIVRDQPLDEVAAMTFARQHGIEIPDDVHFYSVPDGSIGNNYAEYAQFGDRFESEMIPYSSFFNVNRQIPVRVEESVLLSDEAILAIFAHEMYELNSLRELFRPRGAMRARVLRDNIETLHEQAVRIGDDLVERFRQRGQP